MKLQSRTRLFYYTLFWNAEYNFLQNGERRRIALSINKNENGKINCPMDLPQSRCTHIISTGRPDYNAPRRFRLQVSIACSALLLISWSALVLVDRDRVQEDLSAIGASSASSREGQRPIKLPPFVKCHDNAQGSQDCFVDHVRDSSRGLLEMICLLI